LGARGEPLAAAIDEALAPLDEPASLALRNVLRAIAAASHAADKTTVVFIDEVQRLVTHWADPDDGVRVQEDLAEVMEGDDAHLVLLLAGSERSAVEGLFEEGMPLHHDGMGFEVPPINDDDWMHALPRRFEEVGLEVDRACVRQILDASGGHPQRTMRVCAHVAELADGAAFEVTDVLVRQAIRSARRHPSW
jgi:hypothetical protein